MSKDAPAFDLSEVLETAAKLSATHGVKVRVSKSGGITIDPPSEGRATSTERVKRYRAMKRGNAGNAGNDETHETHETHETLRNANETETPPLPSPPSLPLASPSLPPLPAPTGHPSPRIARETPTLEQVKCYAPQAGVSEAEAETWWLAREASDWLRSSNGTTTPVGNWQADMKSYTNAARNRAAEQAARGTQRFAPAAKPLRPADKSDVMPSNMPIL